MGEEKQRESFEVQNIFESEKKQKFLSSILMKVAEGASYVTTFSSGRVKNVTQKKNLECV